MHGKDTGSQVPTDLTALRKLLEAIPKAVGLVSVALAAIAGLRTDFLNLFGNPLN